MKNSPALPSLPRRRLCWLISLLLSGATAAAAQNRESDPPDHLAPGWWRDATFYEVFVRSFADASSGPLAGDGIGDLQGLIEHLDYLNDGRGAAGKSLGVNALWLMPVQPSPSYHGYDVTDYFAVNPDYGDLPLFRRFVQEAHRRGIRVIIDFVLNHCSSRHPLFERALVAPPGSDARQLFRFAPVPEDVTGPWEQRAWHPGGGSFYYGVFSAEMPDWNFDNPAVTEHHRRAAEFWLKDVGVDGLRLDAVRYFIERDGKLQDTAATREWLRAFTDYCHAVKPGSFIVGEDTAGWREVARCIRGGSLDSAFEFTLARATIESIRLDSPGLLEQTTQRLEALHGPASPWATFLSNHDQDRVASQLDGDPAKLRLAAGLLFTLPGVPFVYYGEELGLRGTKPDPDIRTPMPWTANPPNAGFTAAGAHPWRALNPGFDADNVARETATPDSLLAHYRRLIRLHAASPALRHGVPLPVACSDPGIYAAMRTAGTDTVLVLANFSDTPRPGAELSLARSALRAGATPREELTQAAVAAPVIDPDGGFAHWRPLATLAPDSVYVLRWTDDAAE